MFAWYWDVILGLLYSSSLIINIRTLIKCTITDPGIIPAIPSENIDKKKDYCMYSIILITIF
jgi:hypothetical protein